MRARFLLDHILDAGRFRIDTFPWTYQPSDSSDIAARRATGTRTRWARMSPLVGEMKVTTAADVGCNAGWFVLQLAQSGVSTIGIDGDRRFARILTHEISRRHIRNAGGLYLQVTPGTVTLIPEVDAVLFLSVWHHIVHHDGLDAADAVLRALWSRTEKVLFFETGEDDVRPTFSLPSMKPSPREWLGGYLTRVCHGSDVRHLGQHPAFAPDGVRSVRNLFAVVKPQEP